MTPDEKAVQVWQRILDSYTMLDTNGKEISFVSPSNTPARLTIDCVKWIAASIEEAKKEARAEAFEEAAKIADNWSFEITDGPVIKANLCAEAIRRRAGELREDGK